MTGGRSPRNPIIIKKSLPENEERLFLIVLIDSYLLPTVN